MTKTGDWLSAKVGDELVMMSVERGQYMGLSETGVRIWDMLQPSSTLEDICAQLVREYDVEPAQVTLEVECFLKALSTHGAIKLTSATPD